VCLWILFKGGVSLKKDTQLIKKEHQVFLLKLAKAAINSKFNNYKISHEKIPQELTRVGCCFVTLSLNGELRGCIGHLEAFEPLYLNVINNAINAAFNDSRFNPLSVEEFRKVKIEISVLSKPERLVYSNPEDLLVNLSSKSGVILKKGFSQATFLPQVWEIIPDKVEFLENLCVKAGLRAGAWRDGLEIFIYGVEKFSE